MVRNIKIGFRSAFAFGILGIITLILGTFSITQLSQLNSVSDTITLHRIPALTTSFELEKYSLRAQLLLARFSDAQSQTLKNEILQQLNDAELDYDESVKQMEGLVRSGEAKMLLQNVENLHDKFTEKVSELFELYKQRDESEALSFRRNEVMPLAEKFVSQLDRLSEYQIVKVNQINDEAIQKYLTSRTALISGITITLILLTVIAFFYSRSLIIPLRYAVSAAQLIAKGDLTKEINDPHKDEAAEMLHALSDMQTQLKETLTQIGSSSHQLATTSEQLTVVTNHSSQIATNQREQLEQAATAVNELTVAIEDVARSANTTSENAETADDKAQLGQKKINETIEIIGLLASEIQNSTVGISSLASNIKNIGSVLDVIRDIADQTNLLALNAAIEAARAGESGRGFAVVADEVRALAHRTQESTKEIEQMIQKIQTDTSQAVVNMNKSNELAEGTLTEANDAGTAFCEITGFISQISNQNLTVASAAEEQTIVAREVDKNLVHIRDLSIQSSDVSEQTDSSSRELAKLAEHLNELVLNFKL